MPENNMMVELPDLASPNDRSLFLEEAEAIGWLDDFAAQCSIDKARIRARLPAAMESFAGIIRKKRQTAESIVKEDPVETAVRSLPRFLASPLLVATFQALINVHRVQRDLYEPLPGSSLVMREILGLVALVARAAGSPVLLHVRSSIDSAVLTAKSLLRQGGETIFAPDTYNPSLHSVLVELISRIERGARGQSACGLSAGDVSLVMRCINMLSRAPKTDIAIASAKTSYGPMMLEVGDRLSALVSACQLYPEQTLVPEGAVGVVKECLQRMNYSGAGRNVPSAAATEDSSITPAAGSPVPSTRTPGSALPSPITAKSIISPGPKMVVTTPVPMSKQQPRGSALKSPQPANTKSAAEQEDEASRWGEPASKIAPKHLTTVDEAMRRLPSSGSAVPVSAAHRVLASVKSEREGHCGTLSHVVAARQASNARLLERLHAMRVRNQALEEAVADATSNEENKQQEDGAADSNGGMTTSVQLVAALRSKVDSLEALVAEAQQEYERDMSSYATLMGVHEREQRFARSEEAAHGEEDLGPVRLSDRIVDDDLQLMNNAKPVTASEQ